MAPKKSTSKKTSKKIEVDSNTAMFVFQSIIKAANGLVVVEEPEEVQKVQRIFAYPYPIEFALSVAAQDDEIRIIRANSKYFFFYQGCTMDISAAPLEGKDYDPFLVACGWVQKLASNNLSIVVLKAKKWQLIISEGPDYISHYEFKSYYDGFDATSVTLQDLLDLSASNKEVQTFFYHPKLLTEESPAFSAREVAYNMLGDFFQDIVHAIAGEHPNNDFDDDEDDEEYDEEDLFKLFDLFGIKDDEDVSRLTRSSRVDVPNTEDKGDLVALLDRIEKRSRKKSHQDHNDHDGDEVGGGNYDDDEDSGL